MKKEAGSREDSGSGSRWPAPSCGTRPVLILDEATSATDAQSEMLIHEALQSFVKGRTTFLITHAVTPSVLELVHKIAVMDHGQLVAFGPHEELLANCPAYDRLFHARGRRVRVMADLPEAAAALASEGAPAGVEPVNADAASSEPPRSCPLPVARSIRLATESIAGPHHGEAADPSEAKPVRPPAANTSQDAA